MASRAYPSAPSMTAADKKREDDYRAESDFDTLQRSEEVRADKSRHQRALTHGRKKIGQMQRVMKGRSAGRRRSR